MGALPRPDLPAGPHRDLVEALHDLHHRAGLPSLRAMAGRVGCSHTTVSTVFSAPRVPTWGVLELLVEAMHGDVDDFRTLWLEATRPDGGGRGREPPFVGRGPERTAVRDHLAGGSPGLLLVAGEAGIGKTRLVEVSARGAAPTAVLTGWCRPLSSDTPLLPVADWLRSADRLDDGGALVDAIASSPPYVGPALAALLPELETRPDAAALPPAGPTSERSGDLARLFAAVAHALSALAAIRPIGLVLEDAHWADTATLELLEYLALRSLGAPTVVTWRSEDPAVPARAHDWRTRVDQLPAVRVVGLGPLTAEQTLEQVRLLGVRDTEAAATIQRRSLGHPLFAEQLAAQLTTDGEHADDAMLDDVIGRRVAGLGGPAAVVADVLAVADRSLGPRILAAATGLEPAELADAVRELGARHLLRHGERDDTELRHPLVAEAIRRRMTAFDRADHHRRLAASFEADGRSAAAEIAEHWRAADEPGREWPWRVRAARAAAARFALAEEGDQWSKAIELWPAGEDATVDGLRLLDAHLAAIDSRTQVDLDAAVKLAADALAAFPEVDGADAALLYRLAAEPRGLSGDPHGALRLVDQAIGLLEAGAPSAELVQALSLRVRLCWGVNRADEGADACARGLALSAQLDDVALHRQMLAFQAQHDADAGRLDLAQNRLKQAVTLHAAGPDPQVDVLVGVLLTNVLGSAGAGADRIVEGGRQGLQAAEDWGLDTTATAILRGNVADGLRRAGRVDEAAALIDPVTAGRPTPNQMPVHLERAALDLLRGRCAEATDRMAEVQRIYFVDTAGRAYTTGREVWIDLWCGRPQRAYDVAVEFVAEALDESSVDLGELLTFGARAAADVVRRARPGPGPEAYGERLRGLASAAAEAPFAPHPAAAARPALAATWAAELQRLAGDADPEGWLVAATAWDRLARPFDAAYCRWQAARVAIAHGRRTAATGLLRHAHRQAEGHQPLRAAISATAAGRDAPSA